MPGAPPALPEALWFSGPLPPTFHAFFVEPQLDTRSVCGRVSIEACSDEPARPPPHYRRRCPCCRKVLAVHELVDPLLAKRAAVERTGLSPSAGRHATSRSGIPARRSAQ